ncbi:uncharacterized protein BO97DRAFT_449743 [Aspergillus homomorphus CBS 101889]|uniref:Uncharacterized protein n=1 Tax=Aspergillus homomorphus (strain CBS 101889) TaxID=1450537 RepID=A0A395I0S4_ASPHC|nr:hypothetical protein BO97DRAFT_449743 [Aspergillus homomorphus CBS 101889]RAL13670.1 hypothetical protein BO97DRAFT_449743 [Aspergillus homomorphus CBS 101889]
MLSILTRKRHLLPNLKPQTKRNRETSHQQNNAKENLPAPNNKANEGFHFTTQLRIHHQAPALAISKNPPTNRVAEHPDKENLSYENGRFLLCDHNRERDEMHKGMSALLEDDPEPIGRAYGSPCSGFSSSCSSYYYCPYPPDSLSTTWQSIPTPSDKIWLSDDTNDDKMRASRSTSSLATKARGYHPPQQTPHHHHHHHQQQKQQRQHQQQHLSPQGRSTQDNGTQDRDRRPNIRKARSGSFLLPPSSSNSSSSSPVRRASYHSIPSTSRLLQGTVSSRSKMVGAAAAAAVAATQARAQAQSQRRTQSPKRTGMRDPSPPKRVRWTGKFENLRAQTTRQQKSSRMKKEGPPILRTPELEREGESRSRGAERVSPPPPSPTPPLPKIRITRIQDSHDDGYDDFGSSRDVAAMTKTAPPTTATTTTPAPFQPRQQQPTRSHPQRKILLRTQEEKMAPVPSPRSFTHTRIASLPSIVKALNRPKLIARPASFTQVWEPKNHAYWLGRFVTLTNAFHYEDSFQQPDAATGFGMLSSYSRPLGDSEGDLPNYRIKRAFMVLENVCVTDKASDSLRRFREEYVARHGDRWMD